MTQHGQLASTSESLTAVGTRSPAGGTAVLLPTTGEIVRIAGIKMRPRLKASYAALAGDFRPLKLSGDYHRFASGPLLTILGEATGPFELSLTGEIDTGRSWELPTLVAHLATAANALVGAPALDATGALPSAEAGDTQRPARIVWATGKVDPDLAPQPDDYAIAQKCKLSAPLLAAYRTAGIEIVFIVPAGLDASDREALQALAAENGGPLHEAASLDDVAAALGWPGPAANQVAVASTAPNAAFSSDDASMTEPRAKVLAPGQQTSTGPGANSPWARPLILTGLATLAGAVAAVVLINQPGKPDPEPGSLSVTSFLSELTVLHLRAADRNDCRTRIMTAKPFSERPATVVGDQLTLPTGPDLCGLRFRNVSEGRLSLTLSPDLQAAMIRGDSPLFSGVELSRDEKIDLIFSRAPAPTITRVTIEPLVRGGQPGAGDANQSANRSGRSIRMHVAPATTETN